MGRFLMAGVLGLCGCVEQHPLWAGAGTGGATSDTGPTTTATTSATASSGETVTDGSSTGPGGTGSTATATGGSTGGSVGSSSGGSTGGGAAGCADLWGDGTWTLDAPEILTDLNSSGFDGDPYLSADGLTLYLASDRGGGPNDSDIYYAQRATLDGAFGPVMPLTELNTNDSEWTFAPIESGLVAYFNTDRPGGSGGADVWQVSRLATDDPWGDPQPMGPLNTADNQWDAFTMPDGLTLYFNSDQGNVDNYVATRPSLTEPFGAPVPLSINSNQTDSQPTLTADGLVIIFGSYRGGGMGEQDLWYATRPSTTEDFGQPEVLPAVNSPGNEGEGHLRGDGCELFYVSGDGGLSTWDLHRVNVIPM